MREFGPEDQARFEQLVLPHIDAAFNLAYWLLRTREDAEDVAQESLLPACRYFRGSHVGDARAWLLRIVRNTCYTWLEKNRSLDLSVPFDEELHLQGCDTPETLANADDDRGRASLAPLRPYRPVFARSSSSETSKAAPTKRSQQLRRFPSARSCPHSHARQQLCLELTGSARKEALRAM